MVNTLNPPASVILSWPKPNYVDPEDQGPALFILCILFSIVGIFVVSARIYSRFFLTRAPGSDDFLIILGSILTVILSALIAIANKRYYSGRHIWDVPISLHAPHRLNVWVCEWLYLSAAACIKISILLFYRRLSVSFPAGFRIAAWIGILYNVAVLLGFSIAMLTLCQPVKAFWMSYDPFWAASHAHKFHCATEQVTLPLSGALSLLGDLYSTILPLAMVGLLPRSFRQKLSLYALFGVGFLSVIAGGIRTYFMHRLIDVDYDFLPPLYYTWLNTLAELWIGAFVASAPALKPFFKTFVFIPVLKAKTSGVRSTTAKSPGPWNSSAPWSNHSMSRHSAQADMEKTSIAHGYPQEIHHTTHMTWLELQNTTELDYHAYLPTKRYSKMISFPEVREPSIDGIAVAR